MKATFNCKPSVRVIVASTLLLMTFSLPAQVKLSEQDCVIPTYMVAPPDKNPMFFKGESYQGASKYIYPYGMNDVISDEKADKAWKTVTLDQIMHRS
jgi:hypothetical protein